jgi:hypothetical protein
VFFGQRGVRGFVADGAFNEPGGYPPLFDVYLLPRERCNFNSANPVFRICLDKLPLCQGLQMPTSGWLGSQSSLLAPPTNTAAGTFFLSVNKEKKNLYSFCFATIAVS